MNEKKCSEFQKKQARKAKCLSLLPTAILTLLVLVLGIVLISLKSNFKVHADTVPYSYMSYTGKNLFNIDGDINIRGADGSVGSGNILSTGRTILISNIDGALTYSRGQIISVVPDIPYTISAKCLTLGTGVEAFVFVSDIIANSNLSTFRWTLSTVNTVKTFTFTPTSNKISVSFCSAGGTGAQFTDIQLEYGNTATSYEPFLIESGHAFTYLSFQGSTVQNQYFINDNSVDNMISTTSFVDIRGKTVDFGCEQLSNNLGSNTGTILIPGCTGIEKIRIIVQGSSNYTYIDRIIYPTNKDILYSYVGFNDMRGSVSVTLTYYLWGIPDNGKITASFNSPIFMFGIVKNAYDFGYENGYLDGYDYTQTLDPYNLGYSDCETIFQARLDTLQAEHNQLNNAYNSLFNTVNDNIDNQLTVSNIFSTIISAPYRIVKEGLNFTDPVFGINIAGAILFILSITLVAFLIKKLRG